MLLFGSTRFKARVEQELGSLLFTKQRLLGPPLHGACRGSLRNCPSLPLAPAVGITALSICQPLQEGEGAWHPILVFLGTLI